MAEFIRYAIQPVFCPKCSVYVCEWTIENVNSDMLPKQEFVCREPGCLHKFVAKYAVKGDVG